MSGIRAELVFTTPETCPVASASSAVDEPIEEIEWGSGDDGVTEQFTAPADSTEMPTTADEAEFSEVFDYGPRTVYEFDRDPNRPCVCEFVEETVGPVSDTYAVDGDLHVTIHARDITDLRKNIRAFQDRFGDVRIEHLVSGRSDDEDSDITPVDVRRLTDRQQEVLETATEMGYFDYPRGANAGEVADELGIQPSTFTEHLNAAQSKILDELGFGE
ncbi:helix-turn-helix domain-containing protein [Halovenus salina]|uniref:Helix-turn-helix domain-containing protein n=1 Tax=Halovenus salina TaxID=1510225 RepID=A0ABD5W5P1_9EURY|nr:helix-turn-helix domain-containing protein [Halovenus salina]